MSDPQNPEFKSIALSDLVDTPGYNYGATGMPAAAGWYANTGLTLDRDLNSQGVANVLNVEARKFGTGDFNGLDLNMHTRGGQVDSAGEGLSAIRPYIEVGLPPYQATIATGGPGATMLTMKWANDRSHGVGQTLLDMSSATSCNVTGVSGVGGNRALDGCYALLATDATFTPSHQMTLAALNNAVKDDLNAGSVQSLTFNVNGVPLKAGDLVCIGGVCPECVRVLTVSPPAPDGTQTLSANVRFQHWPGTIAYVGGPAGQWIEQAQFTKNGLRFVSWVLGAVDTRTLAVFNLVPGGMDFGYLFTGPAILYQGAIITGVRDGNGLTNGYYATLSDNNAAWVPGTQVESPNHFTAWWQGYVSYVRVNNPFSTGAHHRVLGSGAAFGGISPDCRIFHYRNEEPPSSYSHAGGPYTLAPFFALQGVFGRFLDLDMPPPEPIMLLPAGNGFCLIALKDHTANICYDGKQWAVLGDINVSGNLKVNGMPVGAQGPKGDPGPKGDTGAQGPAGAPPAGRTGTFRINGQTFNFVNGLLQ